MKKKILSMVLIVCMVLTLVPPAAFADDSVYVVAGVPELCGNVWDGSPSTSPDNIMEAEPDGTYSKVYTDVAVMNDYQFKIVGDGANWYGIDGGDENFTFNVVSVCDVKIIFDPATLKITVTGAGVEIPTVLNVESMRAVGNGGGNWLNSVAWDPAANENLMTEVSSGVYEITYTDLDAFDNYQVKFAANGSWAANWGGVYEGSAVESDAMYNSSDNITIAVPYELADVTLRLDLTNFDFATKTGAKFTVTVVKDNKSDFTYTVSEETGEVTITGYKGSDTDVVIPDTIDGKTVTAIGYQAFYNKNITSATITNGVKTIGDRAFSNCKSLKSVSIPNSVTSIGVAAFAGCESLTNVEIPGSVTSIGNQAFQYCNNLKSITVSSGVETIGIRAFFHCTSLESVDIPGSVTSIGDNAFKECYALTSVTIQNGVKTIGEEAFSHCYGLTSVTIPGSVTSIGINAFVSCTSLESVTIQNGVISTGDLVFVCCTSLTSVTLPDSVTSIGDEAFGSCTSLASIAIPNKVTSIGSYAFYDCSSLESIFLPDKDDLSIGNSAIPGTASQVKYSLDETKGEVTITGITLGTGKTSVAIPATICGYDVVAVATSEQSKVGSHTCKGGTATCTAKASCSLCGQEYDDYADHILTKTEAKAATCTEKGNIEYWTCSVCHKLFRDENGTTETTLEAVTVNATSHTLTKTEAKAATCTEKGNTEYWTCSVCHKLFSDENGTTEITLEAVTVNATGHTPGQWEYNSTQHWRFCNVCPAELDRADHTFSSNTCTVCGYTRSSGGSTSSGGGFSGTYNYPVRVDSTSINGAAVTLDKANAVAGDKVTITVTPDSGKAVDEVIVTDADGKAITVTKTGDSKYSFTMPAGKVNIDVITKAADYQNKIVLQIGNRNILENDATIANDVAPVIVGNRTMLPIRVITETLGGTAQWNANTQTVTLNIDGKTLTMTIGQTISGFDTAPIILNDRTYVPVRYVAEMLGASVEWIGESKQIVITK